MAVLMSTGRKDNAMTNTNDNMKNTNTTDNMTNRNTNDNMTNKNITDTKQMTIW